MKGEKIKLTKAEMELAAHQLAKLLDIRDAVLGKPNHPMVPATRFIANETEFKQYLADIVGGKIKWDTR